MVGAGNNFIISLRVILIYAWGVAAFGNNCHSWGVGMEKLFHIVRVYQLAQGRLSLFPEFYSEIFWDFYGFGDDSVMLEKKYGYTLP